MGTNTETRLPAGYVAACSLDQMPPRGKKTVHLEGMTILIITCGTNYYAVEDRCPQTGRSMAHGEVIDCVLTTPTTGARYDLRTGRYLGGGQLPLSSELLRVFPVRVMEGTVYVRLHGASAC